MSTPQAVSPTETPSPVQTEDAPVLTPVCGPLQVAETTQSTVVSSSEVASIEKDDFGTEFFCLRDAQAREYRVVVPVRAADGRTEEGPWTSLEHVVIHGVAYELQVSAIFPIDAKRERLYGILVPVSTVAASASGKEGMGEEPIVVWGSEDEGEGPSADEQG